MESYGARQLGTVSRRQIDRYCRSFAHSPSARASQKGSQESCALLAKRSIDGSAEHGSPLIQKPRMSGAPEGEKSCAFVAQRRARGSPEIPIESPALVNRSACGSAKWLSRSRASTGKLSAKPQKVNPEKRRAVPFLSVNSQNETDVVQSPTSVQCGYEPE